MKKLIVTIQGLKHDVVSDDVHLFKTCTVDLSEFESDDIEIHFSFRSK